MRSVVKIRMRSGIKLLNKTNVVNDVNKGKE